MSQKADWNRKGTPPADDPECLVIERIEHDPPEVGKVYCGNFEQGQYTYKFTLAKDGAGSNFILSSAKPGKKAFKGQFGTFVPYKCEFDAAPTGGSSPPSPGGAAPARSNNRDATGASIEAQVALKVAGEVTAALIAGGDRGAILRPAEYLEELTEAGLAAIKRGAAGNDLAGGDLPSPATPPSDPTQPDTEGLSGA